MRCSCSTSLPVLPAESIWPVNRSTGSPRFFPGAAVNPAAEPFELVMQKVRKKVDSGARFFQTQAVFSRAELERLMTAVAAAAGAGHCRDPAGAQRQDGPFSQ